MSRRRAKPKKNLMVPTLVLCLLLLVAIGGGVTALRMRGEQLDRSRGREPLPQDFTASALADEGGYSLSRALCQSEEQRLSAIKAPLRAGQLIAQSQLATSVRLYDMWYDEGARTFHLPEGYQLTDDELTQMQSKIDTLTARNIVVSAAGDLVIGGDPRLQPGETISSYDWFETLKESNGGLNSFLQDVAPIFQADDMTLVNLECCLCKATITDKKNSFKAPTSYAKLLPAAGIDAVCLANNHTSDFAKPGLLGTRNSLKAVGVKSFHRLADRTATFVTENGIKIGMLGYTMPARRDDLEVGVEILRDEKRCDIVIVSFHWTTSEQGTSVVSEEEQDIARYAIDVGADLVLGHHKHVVSGIERYKDRMIVYDLGNLLSTFTPISVFKYTMIYQQTFTVFQDGAVQLPAFHIIPVLNSDALGDAPNDGHVHVADSQSARKILDQIMARTPQRELWPLIDEGMKSAAG